MLNSIRNFAVVYCTALLSTVYRIYKIPSSLLYGWSNILWKRLGSYMVSVYSTICTTLICNSHAEETRKVTYYLYSSLTVHWRSTATCVLQYKSQSLSLCLMYWLQDITWRRCSLIWLTLDKKMHGRLSILRVNLVAVVCKWKIWTRDSTCLNDRPYLFLILRTRKRKNSGKISCLSPASRQLKVARTLRKVTIKIFVHS